MTSIAVSLLNNADKAGGRQQSNQSAPRASAKGHRLTAWPPATISDSCNVRAQTSRRVRRTPIRKPASTRPVGAAILPRHQPLFHPLWVRHRLMLNFAVKNLLKREGAKDAKKFTSGRRGSKPSTPCGP